MDERIGTIRLRGLSVYGHHGILDFERRDGQTFVVDVLLEILVPSSDDISQTVDYSAVAGIVAGIVAGQPVNLIETLAMTIADRLAAYPRIRRVEVTVHKPEAPIGVQFSDVSVSVEGASRE